MKDKMAVEAVRKVLGQFQDGYIARDLEKLDAFITLFSAEDDIELIGIGAFERGGVEWFVGAQAVGEIIRSDWEYWGEVTIDVAGARITTRGDAAWLTTTGILEQTDTFDKALPIYLEQMAKILGEAAVDPDERLLEASHYGVRRLRERLKGLGHKWPFVISAVLVKEDDAWKFHTIHWSMPVD